MRALLSRCPTGKPQKFHLHRCCRMQSARRRRATLFRDSREVRRIGEMQLPHQRLSGKDGFLDDHLYGRACRAIQ